MTAARPAGADPYQPYRSTLLPPERVRALSRLRPAIVVRDVALCWTAILAAWAVAAAWPAWWVRGLAAVVVGTRYYALFIIAHDGLHRRLWPTRRANDLFTDACILGAIGAITRLNNHNHLLHHRLLGSPGDPDRYRHACADKADRLHFVGFLSGLASVARAIHAVFLAPHGPRRPHEGASPREGYAARDVAILLAWQVALVGGLTWAFGWWGYPVMWLAPLYVFTYLADLVRSFAEHSHPEGDADADHHRLVTFESHPLERYFLAPMHMNRHVAHHLWTGIPYYNLPRADAESLAHPAAATLERRGTYLAYLLRYWLALPLEPCRRAAAPGDA